MPAPRLSYLSRQLGQFKFKIKVRYRGSQNCLGVAGAGWRPAQDVLFLICARNAPMKRSNNTLSASSLEDHFSPCSAGSPDSMLMNAHAPPWAGPQWAVDDDAEVSSFFVRASCASAFRNSNTHVSQSSTKCNAMQLRNRNRNRNQRILFLASRHHEMLREPKVHGAHSAYQRLEEA